MYRPVFVFILMLATFVPIHAADWTHFRGPNGSGVSNASNLATEMKAHGSHRRQ